MNEYRCTINVVYSNPKCFGFSDLEARQGYYIKAESEQEAIAIMQQRFPDEAEAGFTAHLWKIDCPVCRGEGKVTPRSLGLGGLVLLHAPVVCDLCRGAGEVEMSVAQAYYDRIT